MNERVLTGESSFSPGGSLSCPESTPCPGCGVPCPRLGYPSVRTGPRTALWAGQVTGLRYLPPERKLNQRLGGIGLNLIHYQTCASLNLIHYQLCKSKLNSLLDLCKYNSDPQSARWGYPLSAGWGYPSPKTVVKQPGFHQ